MKFSISRLTVIILILSGFNAFSQKKIKAKDKAAEVVKEMQRVADWQVNKWNTDGFKYSKADWTLGACYTGIFALGALPGNEKYLDVLVKVGQDLNWNTGRRRFYADDYCVAQTYLQLYLKYKDPKMIAPFRALADSIVAQPHTETLNWKNNIATREWAWCDALFMGPPALSYLSVATGNEKYTNTAIKLWWKTTEFLYDLAEKLYFRDETYLDKKEKNGQKVFWSRGNGWVIAGLVRLLEGTPANHPDRKKLENLYKDMATRIVSLQQPDGSWHASLLDPESYPIKEMSGTGFYCYSLAWGVNHGLLNKKVYWPAVEKAWATLKSAVQPDGMLGYVQPIGASPDKVDATSTEVYGVGAFLLSGSEIYKNILK